MELLTRFKEYLVKNNLIKEGDSVLLGVSGGPDSLTMLDLFTKIKGEYCLNVVVFHLNHMFRNEAFTEAVFVKNQTENYGLKAIIEEFDVPKYIKNEGLSPEEAAREVRFKLMKKWVRELKLQKIALAHNRDDLVETVFLNLIRGTGLKGLVGIEPVTIHGQIEVIHPLLSIYREEIEEYCRHNGLKPVYDQTNKKNIYTRNKLRNEVIPYLEKEINPGLKAVIARTAEHIGVEENYLSRLADKKLDELIINKKHKEITLNLQGFKKSHIVLRNRIIKKAIGLVKGDYIDIYSAHYEEIDKLIQRGQTGKYVELTDGISVRLLYDNLIIEKRDDCREELEAFSYKLSVPGKIILSAGLEITAEVFEVLPEWKTISARPEVCICDLGKIEQPLTVRNRKPGDRFRPLGMKGFKKLKDFFIDEKIPERERNKIPIILDNSGQLIWVGGLRMDDRYKVTGETNKFLKLGINYQEGD